MPPTIRQEETADAKTISALIIRAYQAVPYSDHHEHFMVERLRMSDAFVPELSLIAETDDEPVGHILLTRVVVCNERFSTASLSLAPLSVVPSHQRIGVGNALVREAHWRAAQLGFRSVILIGVPDYYERFGYQPMSRYPITVPFEVPERNCMVLELVPNGLTGVSGTVIYPPEWMTHQTD